jgi:hypothetical protein
MMSSSYEEDFGPAPSEQGYNFVNMVQTRVNKYAIWLLIGGIFLAFILVLRKLFK